MHYQLDDEAWMLVLARMAADKVATVVIEHDVLAWLREQGRDYQLLIDRVLPDYVNTHGDRSIPNHRRPARDTTDWAQPDAMQDEDIDFSDISKITASDATSAAVWPPRVARRSVAVYSDIHEWFTAHDRTPLRTINALLRGYMETQRIAIADVPAQPRSRP